MIVSSLSSEKDVSLSLNTKFLGFSKRVFISSSERDTSTSFKYFSFIIYIFILFFSSIALKSIRDLGSFISFAR